MTTIWGSSTNLNLHAKLIYYDLVMRITSRMSVKDAGKKRKKNGETDLGDKFDSSLYAKDCSVPEMTREALESEPGMDGGPSELSLLIQTYATRAKAQKELKNPYGDAYKTVILGACFMSHGCTIPTSFLDLLREIYPHVGLMRDGLKQMKKALGLNGYKNGEPYDFGSLPATLAEKTKGGKVFKDKCGKPLDLGSISKDILDRLQSGALDKDMIYPNSVLINVPAPNDFATEEQIAGLGDKVKERLSYEKTIIEAVGTVDFQACNTCKVDQFQDGSDLKACQKCQAAKYCSVECQRAGWRKHKIVCPTIATCVRSKGVHFFLGSRALDPKWKESLLVPELRKS